MNLGVINIDFVIETKEVSEKSEKKQVGISSDEIYRQEGLGW